MSDTRKGLSVLYRPLPRRTLLKGAGAIVGVAAAARIPGVSQITKALAVETQTWYLHAGLNGTVKQAWHPNGDAWGGTALDFAGATGVRIDLMVKRDNGVPGWGYALIHNSCDSQIINGNKGIDVDLARAQDVLTIFGKAAYHHVVPTISSGTWQGGNGVKIATQSVVQDCVCLNPANTRCPTPPCPTCNPPPAPPYGCVSLCYTGPHLHQGGNGTQNGSYSVGQSVTTASTKPWKWTVQV